MPSTTNCGPNDAQLFCQHDSDVTGLPRARLVPVASYASISSKLGVSTPAVFCTRRYRAAQPPGSGDGVAEGVAGHCKRAPTAPSV